MFDWLFEGGFWVYVTLAIPAVALLGMWVRDRKAGWLYGVGVVALVAALVFLFDIAVETRDEQIRRKLHTMAAAVKNKDADAIFQHISPTFRLGTMDKAAFRQSVEAAFSGVNELQLWETKFTDDRGRVTFKAKPRGTLPGSEMFWLVRAEFVQDTDKQWRLHGFEVFNPYNDSNTPLDVGRHLPR